MRNVYQKEQSYAISGEAIKDRSISGEVGRVISTGDALAIGCTLGTMLYSKGRPLVVVGHDNRHSSEALEVELCRGLAASGCYVLRTGISPAPAVEFTAHCLEANSVVVSGGNQPQDHNGFEIMVHPLPLAGDPLKRLARQVRTGNWVKNNGGILPSSIHEAYLKNLSRNVQANRRLKIAWDLCSGAVGMLIGELTNKIVGEHILLNDEPDSKFNDRPPSCDDPGRIADLTAIVTSEQCDFGLILDADCRNVALIDNAGQHWTQQHIFELLLATIKPKQQPPPMVVMPIDTGFKPTLATLRHGTPLVFSPRDHYRMMQMMLEYKACLGMADDDSIVISNRSEMYPVIDGLQLAVRIISYASTLPTPLSHVYHAQEQRIFERRKLFRHSEPDTVIQAMRRQLKSRNEVFHDIDGVRQSFELGFWWLGVDDNPEDARLQLIVEALSEESLNQIEQLVMQLLLGQAIEEITESDEQEVTIIDSPAETVEQPADPQDSAKKISEEDREEIDFLSRHWGSIRPRTPPPEEK